MGAVADVYEIFNTLYFDLQDLPGLIAREAPFEVRRENETAAIGVSIGSGPGFRATWWAVADVSDGRSFAFEQSLAWRGDEWIVEASIIATEQDGSQNELVELPIRYAIDNDDLVKELLGQAHLLVSMKGTVWKHAESRR